MRSELVILQSNSDDYRQLAELTHPTIDRYAAANNIDVVRYRTSGDLFAVCKTKIKNMIGLLESGYSHVLWIDTDAYIQTPQPLSFPEGDLFIAKDVNGINAGVMAVSQGAIPMLEQVLSMPMTAPWYEQGLIERVLDDYNVVYMPQRDFNAYFYELYGLSHPEGHDSITDHVVVEKSIVSRKELHNAPIEVIKQKAENAILDSLKPVERWKPELGEKYWYIHNYEHVCSFTHNDSQFDEDRIKVGNCFRTESEAIAARERVKKALSETTPSDNKFAIFEGKVVEVIKYGGKPAYIMGFDPLPPITAPPLFATREEAEKALMNK